MNYTLKLSCFSRSCVKLFDTNEEILELTFTAEDLLCDEVSKYAAKMHMPAKDKELFLTFSNTAFSGASGILSKSELQDFSFSYLVYELPNLRRITLCKEKLIEFFNSLPEKIFFQIVAQPS